MTAPDWTGHQFGLWTVTGPAPSRRGVYVQVRCTCGTRRTLRLSALRAGKSKSCHCSRVPKLEGATIGRWRVLRHIVKSIFVVRCGSCRSERELHVDEIRASSTQRCGCSRARRLSSSASTGRGGRGLIIGAAPEGAPR